VINNALDWWLRAAATASAKDRRASSQLTVQNSFWRGVFRLCSQMATTSVYFLARHRHKFPSNNAHAEWLACVGCWTPTRSSWKQANSCSPCYTPAKQTSSLSLTGISHMPQLQSFECCVLGMIRAGEPRNPTDLAFSATARVRWNTVP